MNENRKQGVLISGGSGLIGMYLTSMLLEKGYAVAHLSRNTRQFGTVRVFRWNPEKGYIDEGAFNGVNYIVHLAGANIGEKRWTDERKKEIINSRVQTALLIHKYVTGLPVRPKAFISASAAGYYGAITTDKIFKEDDPPSDDFLGTTCRLWEKSSELFSESGIRTVRIRTSVALDKNDSALSRILETKKFGFVAKLGHGEQYMPWIHIEDLCNIYIKAIEDDKMTGSYNACAPQHVTNAELVSTIAGIEKVRITTVPSLVLKTLFGEMSDVLLKGSRISSEKITGAGFRFRYADLKEALAEILSRE